MFGAQAYEGEDGPARAHRNLKRFVEAHMVPESPWVEGKNAEAIGDGGTIWWEEKGGVRMVSSIWRGRGMGVVADKGTDSAGGY